jgi:hypothetical protein
VIDAMGALLPAWHILRQTNVATREDRAVIEAWLVDLAERADHHPGENNVGAARGAADMMLGLMVGDDARFRKASRPASWPNSPRCGPTAASRSRRTAAAPRCSCRAATSR